MQLLAELFGAHRVTVHSGSRKSKTHEMSLADYAKWSAGRGGGSDGKDAQEGWLYLKDWHLANLEPSAARTPRHSASAKIG